MAQRITVWAAAAATDLRVLDHGAPLLERLLLPLVLFNLLPLLLDLLLDLFVASLGLALEFAAEESASRRKKSEPMVAHLRE